MGYDPRIIANFIIADSMAKNRPITNLALQKLLYLAHAQFFMGHDKPLVSGYFEAWKFGPVMPSIYKTLKKFGREPITELFEEIDLFSGEVSQLPQLRDQHVIDHLTGVLFYFGRYSAGQLVDVTHASEGPWHHIWHKSRTDPFADRRISDSVTKSRFAKLKLSV